MVLEFERVSESVPPVCRQFPPISWGNSFSVHEYNLKCLSIRHNHLLVCDLDSHTVWRKSACNRACLVFHDIIPLCKDYFVPLNFPKCCACITRKGQSLLAAAMVFLQSRKLVVASGGGHGWSLELLNIIYFDPPVIDRSLVDNSNIGSVLYIVL